jgi:endogenous inhibitor of DNA gyrase (YacG/DUF329 family)
VPTRRCPICSEAVAREASAFPFCSPRCRLIDLGNWLGERYQVAAEPVDMEAGARDDRDEAG